MPQAGARVQPGCHSAAELIEARDVLYARAWHPQAADTPSTVALSAHDSAFHVACPETAREVGQALRDQLGDLVTVPYTGGAPEQKL